MGLFDPDPNVTWQLSSRRRRKDDLEASDQYDNFTIAKEFANELVEYHGHYEAILVNSKGVEVYNTRRAGIKRLSAKKPKH